MHETQRRLLAQAVPRLRRSQPDGGEGRLDGVRRPEAPPVRRREVVEGEQLLAVPRQAISGPGKFRLLDGEEEPYLMQHRLHFTLTENPLQVRSRMTGCISYMSFRTHSKS